MPNQEASDVTRFLWFLLERRDWNFTLGGERLLRSDMTDDNFVLPLLLWRSDVLHRTAFGSETGLKMVADESAFFGAKANIEGVSVPMSVLLLFCNEALNEVALQLNNRNIATDRVMPQGESLEFQIDSMVNQWIRSVDADRVPGVAKNDLSLAPMGALLRKQDLTATI